VDRVAETAVMRGLVTRAVAKQLSADQVLSFLFAPGFSTRLEATELSGRGVGLDVVKKNLEEIRGTCRLETEPGKGSRFILQVPATLLIQQLLFFKACGQPFAVPLSQVIGIYEVPEKEILSILERKGIQIENETLTVFRLERALGLPENGNRGNGKVLMLVVRSLEGKTALVIDEILEEADRIIKSLPSVLGEVPYIFGVTLNDLGEAVLVFHTPHLASSLIKPERITTRGTGEEAPQKRKIPEILVVDDSQLIRDVLREILETEGYNVQLAVDGQDALERAEAFSFDIVVTDVEMPRMNGFDLLTSLRQSEAYRRTPILIVSARETDQDKRRGLELGATAYIGKSKLQKKEFTNLLQSILGSEIYS
ncbi:MAG: response regulator, partial [Armatimonadetes bacterium]|nr:response regulator [Armatimonadota bacterium]